MNFDQFIEKAKQNGLLIEERKPWSQKHDFCNTATIGKNGVCAALSAVWLRFRHDPAARAKTLDYFKTEEGRGEVMNLAIQYMQLKQRKPLADHLQNFGYKCILGIPQTPDFKIVRAALDQPGFYLVAFEGAVKGHLIAVDGLSSTIFDPNHGEVKLRNVKDTAGLTINLVRGMYPKMRETIEYLKFIKL